MPNNDGTDCPQYITETVNSWSDETKKTLTDHVSKHGSDFVKKCGQHIQGTDPVSSSNQQKSLKALLFDIHSETDDNASATTIETTVNMFMQKAQEELDSAITALKQSGMNYQTAAQLEKSGVHIENVQSKVSTHNQNILSNLASDIMTAKRVATINQQNTIHANVVTEYMQLCCIFFAIAIVIMFLFSIEVVRSFFSHPFVVMQILLVLLFTILVIIILYRVFTNDNHYWMLYQERVFPDIMKIDAVIDKKCSDTTTTTPTQPAPATHPDVVSDTDESCDAE